MNTTSIIEEYLTANGFEDLKEFEGYKINPQGLIWNCRYNKIMTAQEKSGKLFIKLTRQKQIKKYQINTLLQVQQGLATTIKEEFDLSGFQDLKDFEGQYKINPQGQLWSYFYEKLLKTQEDECGYEFVSLTRLDGTRHKGRIHRLLGIQYLENPDNLPEIDHIDRNRKNNDLSNLRWADDKTQANNKSTNISLLTEEEQEQRIINIREYKRQWAEQNRRQKGIQPKLTFETEEERQEHYKELEMKRVWEVCRTSILNCGNTQIRSLNSEIEQYDITWNRYQTIMKPEPPSDHR